MGGHSNARLFGIALGGFGGRRRLSKFSHVIAYL